MFATERLAFTGGAPLARRRARATVESATIGTTEPVANQSAERERHDRLAYRLLLFFIFVLIFRPQDDLPFLDPFHLAEVSGTAAVIALVVGRASRGRPVSTSTPELFFVFALAAWMLVTAPFSTWPGGAVAVFTDMFSKVIVVFALIINLITTRERFERFVTIIAAGTSYIAVRAIFDYVRGLNLVEGDRLSSSSGLFGNPNDLALNMVAFLPLAIVIALQRKEAIARAVGLIGIPAITLSIIFAKSRGGTIGLVVMVLIFLFKMRQVRPGIAALVLLAVVLGVPSLPSNFTARMSSIFHAEEDPTGSREARKQLLREGYQAFLDNPVMGIGAGQFTNYKPDERQGAWRETHNAPLQVASELGVPGIIIFALIIGSGFVAARAATKALIDRGARQRRRARTAVETAEHARLTLYAAALSASLAGWFMAALFASVAYYWTLYLVLGLAVALRDITRGAVVPGVLSSARRRVAPRR
ncbi:MAG: O-antigen ligase family protein [Vicinamibacterales bacterium]